ncbi:MAG: FecR family protein, partial [Polyangia bacterium]
MSESVTVEDARRAESRARAAAELVVGNELLPGPVPLPDFVFLMGRGKRWRRRAWILATGGSMAAVAAGAVIMLSEPAPISYVVDGAVAIADGIIDASGESGQDRISGQNGQKGQGQTDPAGASVHFSEGTEVALASGARLRVVGRNAHGAALALDRGRARFAVTHLSGAHWSVATGPFTVDVIGTRFTLDWSPRDERLVVDLTAGSVLVRGASVGGPVAMHPGERLIATAADRRVTLSPLVEAQPLPGPLGMDGQGVSDGQGSSGKEAADQAGFAGVSGVAAQDEPPEGVLSTLGAERDRRTDVRGGGSRSSGGRSSFRASGGGDRDANNSAGPGRSSSRRLSRHMDLAMVTPSRDLPA